MHSTQATRPALLPEPHPVRPDTLAQIRALPGGTRPLVICDVDEVVLHFIAHLEEHLKDRGLRFLSHAYKLTGNIAPIGDAAPIDADSVRGLLQGFFDSWVDRQQAVPGARSALDHISAFADIIFLTNLPGSWNRAARRTVLDRNGMPFPMVTNTGPKGGAVAALAAGRTGPVVFIDDSPTNLCSVRHALDGCVLVHFIADPRFFSAAEDIADTHLKTHDWDVARAYISKVLTA